MLKYIFLLLKYSSQEELVGIHNSRVLSFRAVDFSQIVLNFQPRAQTLWKKKEIFESFLALKNSL